MSVWSIVRARPLPILLEAALFTGVAAFALVQYKRSRTAAQRRHKVAADTVINTWEGEGGSVVPPQPSDPVVADPPAAIAPANAEPTADSQDIALPTAKQARQ
jgi:hypothetical protein